MRRLNTCSLVRYMIAHECAVRSMDHKGTRYFPLCAILLACLALRSSILVLEQLSIPLNGSMSAATPNSRSVSDATPEFKLKLAFFHLLFLIGCPVVRIPREKIYRKRSSTAQLWESAFACFQSINHSCDHDRTL